MRRRLPVSVCPLLAAACLAATAGAAVAEPWLVVTTEAPASRDLAARLEAAGGVPRSELAGLAEIGVLAVEGDVLRFTPRPFGVFTIRAEY